MTRPANFTHRVQVACDERRRIQLRRGVLPPECAGADFTEIWYAHCWLMAHLRHLGMDERSIARLCCRIVDEVKVNHADPWDVAGRLLLEANVMLKG